MCAPASRDFSSTAIASGSPPCCLWSWASRSAADIPAGPPPTMSTSTSSVSRCKETPRSGHTTTPDLKSGLPVQLRDHRGHDLEEVPGDAEVGDLEDGRFRVLVDRDDRTGPFHADE